ncbi:hemin uptake protein HemP [Hydrogenophaga sp. OTU3427]|uniref:hemin uptake protein HemP n=1 Tax=Hydrogenophaga sp. OTU3427 TaxID=3043856 RepID=UPI00313DF1C3
MNPAPASDPKPPRADGAGTPAPPPARISSADLLRGQRVVEIEHEGQRYRLQATRQGKLILTK